MSSKLEGLIFDCDGTLVDTMPLHWQAWQLTSARHSLVFPEERFYALGGVPSRDIVKMLAIEQGLALDPLAVAREKEEAYLAVMTSATPIAEVVEVVRRHHGELPMAVASGGTRKVIEMVLAHAGIRSYFQAVVTSEDVVRQKPAPDIFLEAARRIGVAPERCRAFEDTDLGLQAIRAAGMEAVDIRPLRGAEKRPASVRTE
jgi:beta-phosphoglucomutase family hydrolase